MTHYSVVVHRTRNLGDMIQTLALTRLLPQTTGVYRHRLADAPGDRLLVVNGMLDKDQPPRPGSAACLFAGVSGPHFRRKEYLLWMASSRRPIGARDPWTLEMALAAGCRGVLTGCATLTLLRYEGPRHGVYSVDHPGPGAQLTHSISRDATVAQQWAQALEHLAIYRTAEAVYTSRLHVALPCLAFGTPVWIQDPAPRAWRPERFSLLAEVGVPYETLVTADVSSMAQRYVSFLSEQTGATDPTGEPVMPLLSADPGPPGWRFPWR